MFEWHFTVRGPPDTEFDDGRYHGRITLPPEYPMKPPSIILLTVRMFLVSIKNFVMAKSNNFSNLKSYEKVLYMKLLQQSD